MNTLVDIQTQEPEYPYDIDQVGVRNVKLPVKILTKDHRIVPCVATFNLYVSLNKDQRGTHMSRFLEVIQRMTKGKVLNYEFIEEVLKEIHTVIGGNSFIKADFDYFIEKESPVTKTKNLVPLQISFKGSLVDDKYEFAFDVKHITMSLCPCSKEISQYNAHNQRAIITVTILSKDPSNIIWIEDIVDIIEKCSSGPVYSILKRPDEKYVTEYSYEHPAFCEDVVRAIAHEIEDKYKGQYKKAIIRSEHLESIHPHNAYARLILS